MQNEIYHCGPIACGIDAIPLLDWESGIISTAGSGTAHVISIVGTRPTRPKRNPLVKSLVAWMAADDMTTCLRFESGEVILCKHHCHHHCYAWLMRWQSRWPLNPLRPLRVVSSLSRGSVGLLCHGAVIRHFWAGHVGHVQRARNARGDPACRLRVLVGTNGIVMEYEGFFTWRGTPVGCSHYVATGLCCYVQPDFQRSLPTTGTYIGIALFNSRAVFAVCAGCEATCSF